MILKELIDDLSSMKEKYGNLKVVTSDYFYEINKVSFENHYKEKIIWIQNEETINECMTLNKLIETLNNLGSEHENLRVVGNLSEDILFVATSYDDDNKLVIVIEEENEKM